MDKESPLTVLDSSPHPPVMQVKLDKARIAINV